MREYQLLSCVSHFPSLCPLPAIFQLCRSEQCSHGGWWLCCLPYLRGKAGGAFSQTELLPAGKSLSDLITRSDYSHQPGCCNGNTDTAAIVRLQLRLSWKNSASDSYCKSFFNSFASYNFYSLTVLLCVNGVNFLVSAANRGCHFLYSKERQKFCNPPFDLRYIIIPAFVFMHIVLFHVL